MAIYYFCKKGIEYNNTIIIIEPVGGINLVHT